MQNTKLQKAHKASEKKVVAVKKNSLVRETKKCKSNKVLHFHSLNPCLVVYVSNKHTVKGKMSKQVMGIDSNRVTWKYSVTEKEGTFRV